MSAKRKATRGPRLKSKAPTRSIATPPIAIAIGPAAPVTTFEMPMYRPLVAFGTMSVMRAQSTARNAPAAIPTGITKITATTMLGASATPSIPTDPSAHVKYTSAFRPRRSERRAAGKVVSAVVTAITAVATLIHIPISASERPIDRLM